MVVTFHSCAPAINNAPTTAIPEMALAPDIKGVCNVGGTLLITSNPTNDARTKTTKPVNNPSVMSSTPIFYGLVVGIW
ncbi:conserved hypothetical protein [Hyella patelloides LEGE 07179]|uniref:Uncharacterized protein n=1 Tax=Hyella patelloides LEGE 07179 TaxID=945734 RepID=A0A563VVF6_9CYAN|nr:conserved hypothetical protein [Hyella patelloides LEGE 07179]